MLNSTGKIIKHKTGLLNSGRETGSCLESLSGDGPQPGHVLTLQAGVPDDAGTVAMAGGSAGNARTKAPRPAAISCHDPKSGSPLEFDRRKTLLTNAPDDDILEEHFPRPRPDPGFVAQIPVDHQRFMRFGVARLRNDPVCIALVVAIGRSDHLRSPFRFSSRSGESGIDGRFHQAPRARGRPLDGQ